MGTKYDILKITTIAGTFFSVYSAFTDKLILEDLLMVMVIAVCFVAVARDFERSKNSHEAKLELTKELAKTVEETIKKQIAT